MREFPHGIMFHHFHNERHSKGQGSIGSDEFARILHYVGLENILSADEWLADFLGNRLRPNQTCITFDDSLLCQYEIALPVLQRYNLKAFWFVYTSVVMGEVAKLEIFRKFRSVFFPDFGEFYTNFLKTLNDSSISARALRALRDFVPGSYLPEYAFYSDDDRRFRYLRDKVLGPNDYFAIMDQMVGQYVEDLDAFSSDLWMTAGHIKTLHESGHV
ncbi:MAG: polysaccharide deacetylase family protein, partial [Proteobacteria bacterium]|nr:polysaccharide deacetylase family protein [Pseudomonadota bacterium]